MQRLQRKLAQVGREPLSDADRLNKDILAFQLSSALDLEEFPEHLLPLNQMDNVPSTLANFASGTGSQPLGTPAAISRLSAAPASTARLDRSGDCQYA